MAEFEYKKATAPKVEDNRAYQMYAHHMIKDVPNSEMRIIIDLFLQRAAVNMGSDLTDNMSNMVVEFAYNEFSFMPVYSVASSITKGSLGHYGVGRLVPRTVYGWFTEAANEFNRKEQHEAIRKDDYSNAMDLNIYPVGQALAKKITWYKDEVINMTDWDKLPLKEMSERIHQKLDVVPELWGVKSKPKKKRIC